MTFEGILNAPSFQEFAEHRAGRLDLGLAIIAIGGGSATMVVEGHEALVDAFEMACSLGPADCIVRDVRCSEIAPGSQKERSKA